MSGLTDPGQSYLFGNLRKVISLVDKLRDFGLQNYISMPRIAVLGTQSAGKSSLLEQIVGLDFLPRGSGVVTRRPLELRLIYVQKDQLQKPYGVFEELKDQKFEDFLKVKQTINELTDKVAGANKGIVDKPIILTIYSSSCPNLTLIDLPGITRIPMQGTDQPKDIEGITKAMAKKYCENPETIILCVIPANQDMTVSDGLQMARQLDPEGNRTIGVLTKIDIMDKGTDARNMLLGKEVPLKMGYIGVINRSQEDINNNKPVSKHLEYERTYFANHPVYSSLSKYVGTEKLTLKLTDTLYYHIRQFLPKLEKEIEKQANEVDKQLKEMGTSLPVSETEKNQYLWQITNQFIVGYKNSISGTYSKQNVLLKNKDQAGCKIREILNELYEDQAEDMLSERITDSKIQMALMQYSNAEIPGFLSFDAFLGLIIPEIKELKKPAFECIDEVYLVLDEIANLILENITKRTPQLKQELTDSIILYLQSQREQAKKIVEDILEAETGYIFTNNLEMIAESELNADGKNKDQNENAKKVQIYNNASSSAIIQDLKKKLDTYYSIIIKNMRDTIPKMIGFIMVKQTQENLRQTLFDTIYKSEHFYKLIEEPQHLVELRKSLQVKFDTMKQSLRLIKKDPDFSILFTGGTNRMKESTIRDSAFGTASFVGLKSEEEIKQLASKQYESETSRTMPPSNQRQGNLFNAPTTNQPQQVNQNQGYAKQQPHQNLQNQPQMDMLKPNDLKQPGQPNQSPKGAQQVIDNAIDKGVDQMFQNEKFQQGMRDQANKQTQALVNSKIPMQDSEGNNPIANLAGNVAEKIVANNQVQNFAKQQMADQLKQQAQLPQGPGQTGGSGGNAKPWLAKK